MVLYGDEIHYWSGTYSYVIPAYTYLVSLPGGVALFWNSAVMISWFGDQLF